MKHFVIVAILVVLCTFLVYYGLVSLGLLPQQASLQAVSIDQLFNIHLWLISFLFSLIVGILILGAFLYRYFPAVSARLTGVKKNRAFLRLVSRIVRRLKREDLEGPGRTGWIAWRNRFEARLSPMGRNIDRFTRILLESLYGERRASPRDIRYVRLFYGEIRRQLKADGMRERG